MSALSIKPGVAQEFDLIALGEVMLRLDPGEGRIRTAREFKAWEGGGEYNVARGLSRCFGLRTAVCSAFADNEVGRLLEGLILQGGVDTRFVKWAPFDGIGSTVRNGLNFTERGFGIRGAVGVSDRGHSAASQLRPGDFDWGKIFGKTGGRWFHTGGIFAALSATTQEVAFEAVSTARKHGLVVSYDLNYRPSLWKNLEGNKRAQELNREILGHVNVLFGNEDDFVRLGLKLKRSSKPLSPIKVFKAAVAAASREYPNLKVIATTLRTVKSATHNDWGGVCWAGGKLFEAKHYPDLEILDRIGGGDGFASGLIYGFLKFNDPQKAVDYGAAHGALAMTTPGDNSMASLKEVEALMEGSSARIQR
jgi:2-dehydro-3-deoxygluconokinase